MANMVTRVKVDLETFGVNFAALEASLAYAEGNAYTYSVAASTSQTVNFGSVASATFLLVTADKAFTVTAEGADTAQTYAANGIHLQFNTTLTSLAVANSDATDAATVKVWLGGA